MRLFKICHSLRGGHVHCRVFVTLASHPLIGYHPHLSLRASDHLAPQPTTWAPIGTLTMTMQDWAEFQQHLHFVTLEPDDAPTTTEVDPVDPRRI